MSLTPVRHKPLQFLCVTEKYLTNKVRKLILGPRISYVLLNIKLTLESDDLCSFFRC